MLLAMATGTGKTFTIVALMYRLLKSHYARRILFLVDRRALAAQAVTTISAFETLGGLKFDQEYEVYSQRFRREDFDEHVRFDPKVLPEEYLTNPQTKHTFVYVSTIQRMTLNLFGQQHQNAGEYQLDVRPQSPGAEDCGDGGYAVHRRGCARHRVRGLYRYGEQQTISS